MPLGEHVFDTDGELFVSSEQVPILIEQLASCRVELFDVLRPPHAKSQRASFGRQRSSVIRMRSSQNFCQVERGRSKKCSSKVKTWSHQVKSGRHEVKKCSRRVEPLRRQVETEWEFDAPGHRWDETATAKLGFRQTSRDPPLRFHQSAAHGFYGKGKIPSDNLRLQVQHAIPEPLQVAVPARISCSALVVRATIPSAV